MRFLRTENGFSTRYLRYFSGAAIPRTIDACMCTHTTRVHATISVYMCLVSKSLLPLPRSFHWGVCNRVGEPKRGVLERSWCTVVFHSHYRNVLPCALVAPRNKSSVTVSMGGAQGGYRCWRGVQGVIVAAHTPRPTPRANLCDAVCARNSRNLFFLSFSRSHLGPRNRVPVLWRSRGDVRLARK